MNGGASETQEDGKAQAETPAEELPRPDRRRLILVGATGLVGHEAAIQAAQNPFVDLACPVRSIPQDADPAWGMERLDFGHLDDAGFDWLAAGVAIAIGTTQRQAGSREAFRAVDLDLVVEIARRAREAGTRRCAAVSSLGADPRSQNFYLRTKGEMEVALKELGFPTLVLLRPSLLTGERKDYRLGERLSLLASRVMWPFVPDRYRPVAADAVARSLVAGALDNEPGLRVIRSEDMI